MGNKQTHKQIDDYKLWQVKRGHCDRHCQRGPSSDGKKVSGKASLRTWLFIDGCTANSCDFGVLVRGGELRVFVVCHLG